MNTTDARRKTPQSFGQRAIPQQKSHNKNGMSGASSSTHANRPQLQTLNFENQFAGAPFDHRNPVGYATIT